MNCKLSLIFLALVVLYCSQTEASQCIPGVTCPPIGDPCTGSALQPAVGDCRSFLQCTDGILVHHTCGWLSYFDSVTNECRVFWRATCSPEQSINLCTGNWNLPDPEDCAHYYTCANNRIQHHWCSYFRAYNRDTEQCDWTWNIPYCLPDAECLEARTKAIPNDCSNYMECQSGKWVNTSCPLGLKFDKETLKCVTDMEANCLVTRYKREAKSREDESGSDSRSSIESADSISIEDFSGDVLTANRINDLNTLSADSSTENTPSADPSTKNTPSSGPSTENTPSPDPSTENTPSTTLSTENTPSAGSSTENTPSAGSSTENTPSAGSSTENTPSAGSSTENTPSAGSSTENTPSTVPPTTAGPSTSNTPSTIITTTKTTQPTTTEKPDCIPGEKKFVPNSCTNYYVCNDKFKWTIASCSSWCRHFNGKRCVWAWQYPCTVTTTEGPSTEPTPSTQGPTEPPSSPTEDPPSTETSTTSDTPTSSTVAHCTEGTVRGIKGDCRNYEKCSQGKFIKQTCSWYQDFDCNKMECRVRLLASCC